MRDPINLAGVLLVDAGLAAGFLGLVALLRGRRGALWLASGAALGLAGVALPAPERRVPKTVSRFDEIIPAYQFSEHHEIRIQASPRRVYEAAREVRADEITLFRTLTWIRSPRLFDKARREESILNPGGTRPILEVATSTGFLLLADEPEREIVMGLIVVPPPGPRSPVLSPEKFIALDGPGYAKGVVNFRIEDEGGGWTRLTTETRVYATDASARRRFAAYWRLIYPGSAFIRRMWLRAIRDRATR